MCTQLLDEENERIKRRRLETDGMGFHSIFIEKATLTVFSLDRCCF